jgi:hypothetical protein
MKNSLTRYALPCLLLLMSLTGCKTDDFDGPGLNDLYGEFDILEPMSLSRTSVNFANQESVSFGAAFSKIIDWKITLTGLKTGSQKVITGKSSKIDASNSLWIGNTTVFPIFGAEDCAVMMTFLNEPDTLRDTLTIVAPKTNPGILMDNFEHGLNPNYVNWGIHGVNFFTDSTDHPAAEGDFYFRLNGTVNWDWLINKITIPPSSGATYFALPSNPAGLNFNCFIYGEKDKANTLLKFEFREDDNGDGTYSPNTEDRYDYQLNVDWDGWRLLSLDYSQLVTPGDPQFGGANGNKFQQPDKILSLEILLLSDPNLGEARSDLDYLIWTTGGPLNP